MDGASFKGSGIRRLDVEPGNPLYRTVDDFVIKFDELKLIFYCGSDAEIIIPDFVQIVGDRSFECRESIHRMIFGSRTQISSIERCAFYSCEHLESIVVPSSMKSVGSDCFNHCHSLRSVTFESISKLGEIPTGTFADCPALESICVPASVTHLGQSSFRDCVRLTMISFPADSQLKSIDWHAFAMCSSLTSLVIPSSVEEIQFECFVGCVSLSILTFSSPSDLVVLMDLPTMLENFTEIPDSVKDLTFSVGENQDCGYALIFGLDSQLEDVDAFRSDQSRRRQSFLVFPTGRLKYFRSSLEFGSGKPLRVV
jgi:hypothetical protein